MRYIHDISYRSNAGKYFAKYFMTSDIRSTYTSLRHVGPFIQSLPTRAMKSRADILVGLPSEEKDVKVLTMAENFKQVGLFLIEHSLSRFKSSYEDVDPLDEVSLLAGLVACPPGPVVIREPDLVAVPATSSPIVH